MLAQVYSDRLLPKFSGRIQLITSISRTWMKLAQERRDLHNQREVHMSSSGWNQAVDNDHDYTLSFTYSLIKLGIKKL